jgi:hypothetical protein
MPAVTEGRAETGVMQFGDDWPGVFIRGDNAMHFAYAIRGILELPMDDPNRWLCESAVKSLSKLLQSSNVNG